MKKLSIVILSILFLISIGSVAHSKETSQTTFTVSDNIKYIFEDFRIIEVSANGEIRGEKIQGNGEGIFLLDEYLPTISNAPKHLTVGDKIEVAWTTDDYNNEVWDNIHSIEFIN